MANSLVRKRLDGDIRKALESKGLLFVASGKSDLNVRYTLGAARKVEREVYPAGWRGLGRRVVRVPYTEGTLVVDLRDAYKVEGKLNDMVGKSFDKYPPKPK